MISLLHLQYFTALELFLVCGQQTGRDKLESFSTAARGNLKWFKWEVKMLGYIPPSVPPSAALIGEMIKEPMHRRNIGVMKSSLLTHVYCTLTRVHRFTVWSCQNGIPLAKQWSAPIWSCIRYLSSMIDSKQYVHMEPCICRSCVPFFYLLDKRTASSWASMVFLQQIGALQRALEHYDIVHDGKGGKYFGTISKKQKNKNQSPADHEPKSTECPSLHRGDVTELDDHYTVGVTVMAGGPNTSNYRHTYVDRSTWQAVSSVVKKEAQNP